MTFPAPLDTLSPEELAVLEKYVRTVSFSLGTCIFEEGSSGDSCYVIDQGIVRVELGKEPHTDDDNVLAFLDPGTILGELSLLDRLPRSASAFAHTEVLARRIAAVSMDELAESHPHIALNIWRALGRSASLKVRTTSQRLDQLLYRKPDAFVDEMIERSLIAQQAIQDWPENRIDDLLLGMARAVEQNAEALAVATVEETGIGHVPDKIIKNRIASIGIWHTLAGQTAQGVLAEDMHGKVVDIASPVGLIVGLIPVTNPVSTFIFKALIGVKGRNALILCPGRRVVETCNRVGELIRDVLRDHEAPPDLVQWVSSRNSNRTTIAFMSHRKVSLILATGGPTMVKAAYSSGNPAIGVGPGNAPVLICADADLGHAAQSIVMSKSFDNGLICGSEHNLVVEAPVREALIASLEAQGAAVLSAEEAAAFADMAIDPTTGTLRGTVIGQAADLLAEKAGIRRAYPIKLIVVPTEGISRANPFALEKMAPVSSLFTVPNADEGFVACRAILDVDGAGHTAIIYSKDETLIRRFGLEMPASRILVNSPGTHGIFGITTGLTPSLTLGCGTFGGNSTTDNVTYRHLLNIKRLAYYTSPGAQYLVQEPNEHRNA